MSQLAYTVKGLTFEQKSVLLSARKKLYGILQDLFHPHSGEGGFNTERKMTLLENSLT